MRKSIWRELGLKYKPDKVNKEGFPAFSADEKTKVVNALMTGSIANTYYVDAATRVLDTVKLLTSFEDTEFLAKAIVYAREKGYVREMSIAAAVALSKLDIANFKKIVHDVCKNPHDWQKLIDIARSGVIRDGVGRALKREIINALANMEIYHAIKYPKAVEDMINIARPKPDVNRKVIDYIKRREVTDPRVEALKKLKETDDENVAYSLILDAGLPYEVVTGSVRKMTPKIWEALLYVAPYFNLIRNLRNFAKNGVFDKDENLMYAYNTIKNRKAVRSSKLYPFRFYAAYKALKHSNIYIGIVDPLCKALDIALHISVSNVPPLDGKTCIAPDVSGSMFGKVLGERSVLRCIDIVGVFTGMLINMCKEVPVVLPFNEDVVYSLVDRIMGKENILEIASEFYPSGGTSLSAPIEHLLKENVDVDRIIAITDNEEWVGRPFMKALTDYMTRVNPEVKVYLITLMPYFDYPTPVNMPNVHYIFGWSDRVLDYIASDVNKQVEEIEKINL